MYDLTLVGIGTGNPDHLTFAGANAICQADLILIPCKEGKKDDLAELRLEIIREVSGDTPPELGFFDIPKRRVDQGYINGVDDWHSAIALKWQGAIDAQGTPPKSVALLIWGDPSLYDSALRIAARLYPRPETKVIPGITALQALTAAHAIPLNDIGAPVHITTGRRLRDEGWPKGVETVAVMLDGRCSFQHLEGANIDIWWGAFVGMKEQILLSGRLDKISQSIQQTRAQARDEHGWIMDIYLLKKSLV